MLKSLKLKVYKVDIGSVNEAKRYPKLKFRPQKMGQYNSIQYGPKCFDWLILGAEINHVVIVNNWKYDVK